jgi:sterol 3beta-glucosyltransferase
MSKDNTPFHLRNVSQDRPLLPEDVANEDPNREPVGTWETEPIMGRFTVRCPILLVIHSFLDYSEYSASGKGLLSRARVTEDGRITVSLDLKKSLPDLPPDYAPNVKEFAIDEQRYREVPSLNIVVMIVGSRGGYLATMILSL